MKGKGTTLRSKERAGNRLIIACLLLSTALFWASSSWGAAFPFSDDVENPFSTDWVADTPWARTTAQYHSATTSWTDSPSAFYANSADNALTLATTIDLTGISFPRLSFWSKYQLETGYDYLYVEYSDDNGVSWNILSSYTGYQGTWRREQLIVPSGPIKIRFRLVTDTSVVMDGFYVDDIVIGEKPDAVALSSPSGATSSSLVLNWSPSQIPDFASYRLYRSDIPMFSYQDGYLVAEITDVNTLSFTDTGLAQKSTYYYLLHVVNTLGLYSDATEVSGTTLPGLDYPLQDDMEAGAGNWTPGGDWSLVTPIETHSGNKVWTDSPAGDYLNSSDTSLTLVSDIDLSTATSPQLVFWHRLAILAGDTAYVEVSTDGGEIWTTMNSYTDTTLTEWTRVQIDLTPYVTMAKVKGVSPYGPAMIRFRMVTDATGAADGWDIDDVTLSDKPTDVALSTPVPLSGADAGKMSLSWTVNSDVSFMAYEVHRATSPGVTLSSTLVATITDQGTTAFTDGGLDPNQVYYYKIFVVSGFYAYSDGSNEASESPVGYFFDDMESGVGDFTADSPWARTTENAYSGTTSWTDSPGTTYADNFTASLQFPVDLSGAVMPLLSFWHTYSFEANSDYGYVEISTDGGSSWYKLYFVTGASAEWRQETIDLTVYAGLNILLRFRLQSDGNGGVSDGWHIDDVAVSESSAVISYPFVDNMDDEATTRANWLSSSWDLMADSHSSPFSWHDSPEGNYNYQMTGSSLVLAGVVDLTNAVNPQLNFWHKYSFYTYPYYGEYDYGKVYVSDYYGQTGTWYEVASFTDSQGSWKQEQMDLSSFAGLSKVRVKFVIVDNGTRGQANGWFLDDIEISDAPGDVTISEPTNVTMHGATLTWTQNTDADFLQYEIYRSTSSGVSRSDTLIATITDQATTTYADTPYYILRPDQFHYRIYVKDTTGQYSLGSNVVTAVYTVPTVTYPFTDDAESGTSSWDYSGVWSTTGADNHSSAGAYSFTDSPSGNYENSVDSSLDTIIDLSQAADPVLTFWHKYVFEDGADYGYVQVSNDQGATWATLLSVTGQSTAWNQERIDLGAYVGSAALWLRFRLSSNADINYDGWTVDDISISEGAVVNAYPFTDDVESGIGSWFYDSPWGVSTTNAHSGTTSWADSPGSSYADSADYSLRTTVDLTGSTMPTLTFWHQYSFETNHDYGFVEVSNDNGASWTKLYFVTGSATDWREVSIDLAPYAGDILSIRFRVTADGNGTMADGWNIDDIAVSEATAVIPYPFVDNMDTEANTRGNWISSSWDLVVDGNSLPNSWTDSPEGDYISGMRDGAIVLASVIDLSGAVNPQLTFWHKYSFYTYPYYGEYDYGKVYVSDYYGQSGTWTEVASFTDTMTAWGQVQIDLSLYAGSPNVRVKFVVQDNGTRGVGDGWYLDDVEISDAPTDVAISSPTGVTMHSATLTWSQNTESDFDRYEIYRDTTTGVTTSSQLIATITDPTVTTYTDDPAMILRPGAFSYRIYVVDDTGIYSLGSNVVTPVYTVPGVSVPFSEDAEGDTSNWATGYTWGITTSQAHGGLASFTDSPAGNYPDNADYSLDTTLDLSGTTNPVLTFWHSYIFEASADFGYVQVSTDNGGSWTTLLTVTGQSTIWNQERINLSPYAGTANLWLRFRVVSNGSINNDGWYIDDISVGEGLVVNAFPFSDDIESSVGSWFYNSPWGRTEEIAHSGTWAWTDSPGSTYVDNTDTSLVTTVNLVGSSMPVLTFWHLYSFEPNNDYGFVEVSTDNGSSWTKLYFVTGSAASWIEEKIDLTVYAGTQISLRFRVTSNGNGVVSDGWTIDDINITESSAVISYPFSDSMDDQAASDANWISSSWEMVVNSRSLPNAWHDSPEGYYYYNMTQSSLVLAGVIDLTSAVNPQLSFWHKYNFYTYPYYGEYDYGRVYVSTYYGQSGTWEEVASYTETQNGWTHARIDLSPYVGLDSVRVKFVIQDYGTRGQGDGWWIDDIRIGEKTLITQENSRLVKPGTTVNYAHTIINYTAQADTINLTAVSNHGWTVTLYEDTNGDGVLDDTEITVITDTGSLAGGASYFVIAQVQVPWTTSGTLDITTLTATSTNDPFLTDAVTDKTTVDTVSGVTISPDTAGYGVAGAVAAIKHTIVNDGNAEDDFTLSLASTQGITVGLYHDADGDGIIDATEDTPITSTGPLPSGASFDLIVEIDIPTGALEGEEYGTTITATSTNDVLAFDIATDVITVSVLTSMDIGLDKNTLLVGEQQELYSIGYAGLDMVTFYGTTDWSVVGDVGTIDTSGMFTATAAGLGAIVLYDMSGYMPTVSHLVDVIGPAGGTTQNETGTLVNSDSSVPGDGDIQFQAYIVSRPSEVLSQETPGAGYSAGEWQVNVGNFPTPWAAGDLLHVDFVNTANGEVASVEYALTNSGQSTAVALTPLSYMFETTATTNVNSFVLLLDIGVTDAEGLVNAIPNATEVAYWDAASQAYVAHTKGLSLFNFAVTPGHPYFVTVTANTVWTPSGAVPTTSFSLITTGSTDVNMVGIPLNMSRIKKAEDLSKVIPGCTEVAYWDTSSQAYIAHTQGVPLFDFDIMPGMPVFVTVTEESLWP